MIAISVSSSPESIRFYHSVSEELKKRDISFVTLKAGEAIPAKVRVVLTTPEDAPLIDFHVVVADDDCSLAVEKAVRLLSGFKESHGRLTIGIDPGKTPGVAVIAGNRAVDAFTVSSPEEIRGVIERVISLHTPKELQIRIGRGGGGYRQRILRALSDLPDLRVELVNEDSTSKGNSRHVRDALAALSIALTRGKVLEGYPSRTRIKFGEIKNIQDEARRLSPGLTISRRLAKKVARGELTLEEATKLQRKGKPSK